MSAPQALAVAEVLGEGAGEEAEAEQRSTGVRLSNSRPEGRLPPPRHGLQTNCLSPPPRGQVRAGLLKGAGKLTDPNTCSTTGLLKGRHVDGPQHVPDLPWQ